MGALPPPGCWSCGAVPTEGDIRLDALLHPRSAAEGGPWTGLGCRSCGLEGVLLEAPDGFPVLAPPEAAGLETPAVAILLEGRRARDLRRRAREWMARYGSALHRLRGGTPTASRPAEPPRPSPRAGPGPGPPRGRAAAPPPPPRRPGVLLPRTPEEAREILGVAAGADRKDVDAAFRRRSRKCHPDLVAHLDEDFQRLAHEKFLRLKRAQEILTRHQA